MGTLLSPSDVVQSHVARHRTVSSQLEAWLSAASGLEADEYLKHLEVLYAQSTPTPEFYQALLLAPDLSPWALYTLRRHGIDTVPYSVSRHAAALTPEIISTILKAPKYKTYHERAVIELDIKVLVDALRQRPDLRDADIARLYKSRLGSSAILSLFDHPSANAQSVRALFRTQFSRAHLTHDPRLSTLLYTTPALLAGFYDSLKHYYKSNNYDISSDPMAVSLMALGSLASYSIPLPKDLSAQTELSARINTLLSFIDGLGFDAVESLYGGIPYHIAEILSSGLPNLPRLDNPTIARLLAHPAFTSIRAPLFKYLRPPLVPTDRISRPF